VSSSQAQMVVHRSIHHMKSKTKLAAAKGESVDLLNFKVKTERRLDLMAEWMEHIRFTEACPLPRSPGEIMETEMELEPIPAPTPTPTPMPIDRA